MLLPRALMEFGFVVVGVPGTPMICRYSLLCGDVQSGVFFGPLPGFWGLAARPFFSGVRGKKPPIWTGGGGDDTAQERIGATGMLSAYPGIVSVFDFLQDFGMAPKARGVGVRWC